MKCQTIKINGYELHVNFLDLAFKKRLVASCGVYQKAVSSVDANFPGDDPQMQYNRIEACVIAVCAFFDSLFGPGTAESIFKRSNEAQLYMNAISEFGRELQRVDHAACRQLLGWR